MNEACESVIVALRFVDELAEELEDCVERGDERAIVRRMRVRLPVPAVFAAIKVLHRLLLMTRESRDSYDADRPPKLQRCATDVDYTVRRIYLGLAKRVDRRAAVEFGWHDGRPWHAVCRFLETLIARAETAFFGISICAH
jgi:hypothetical protein